jgi:hypothetical protein
VSRRFYSEIKKVVEKPITYFHKGEKVNTGFIQVMRGLFRLRNVTIAGFYYLLLLKLLHVSVVRPSSHKEYIC